MNIINKINNQEEQKIIITNEKKWTICNALCHRRFILDND